MNYWTKELLQRALPNAKFYNFTDDFSAKGIRVSFANFDSESIALVRLEGEQKGIPICYLDKVIGQASAFITTNAELLSNFNLPIIEVENTQKTLFQLARFKRARFAGTVVDITGSAGKSTATKMCYDALCEYGASANLNQANTNFGLSWNMTTYDQNAKFWINETSLGGGMSMNSLMTMPNIAVVTNIAPVHLKPTQNLINVAIEKSKIFDYIKSDGTAILYKEMEFFDYVYEAALKKVNNIITFGEGEGSDVRIIPGNENYIEVFGTKYKYSDNPTPNHILLDAGIVACICYVCGISVEKAFEKLNSFKALSGRGEVISANVTPYKKVTLVDESFNANPVSMKFSLQGFNKIYGNKSDKVLILGDMAEGGPETEQQHLDLKQYIDEISPSVVLLCRREMKKLWNIVSQKYMGKHYNSADELLSELNNWISNDTYILVKASHSIELYKIVNYVKSFSKL